MVNTILLYVRECLVKTTPPPLHPPLLSLRRPHPLVLLWTPFARQFAAPYRNKRVDLDILVRIPNGHIFPLYFPPHYSYPPNSEFEEVLSGLPFTSKQIKVCIFVRRPRQDETTTKSRRDREET